MKAAEEIKKIDIHAHIIEHPDLVPKEGGNNSRMLTADELLEYYDRLQIEKGVLLPLVSPEAAYAISTSETCKAAADRFPDRYEWFCGVDPRNGGNHEKANLSTLLNHYKALGAKGVGELTANLYADDPKMDNLFAHCEACDMPVIFHVSTKCGKDYGIVDDLGLPRIERMLKKHPNLKLIGHSQAFWSEISEDVNEANRGGYPKGKVTEGRIPKLMREYGNLYCDLSAGSGANAMMRDPEYAARFIEEFSDRIMYGCDICMPNQTITFEFNDFLNRMRETGMISEENYRKIARDNAIRILKLEL